MKTRLIVFSLSMFVIFGIALPLVFDSISGDSSARSGDAAVSANRIADAVFCALQQPTVRGTGQFIVKVAGKVTPAVRQRAEKAGARVLGYLPINSLLCEMDTAALNALRADATFAAITEPAPAAKLPDDLAPAERAPVTVTVLSPSDLSAIRQAAMAHGGKPIADAPFGDCEFTMELDGATVNEFSKLAAVKRIVRYSPISIMNDTAVLPQCMNVTPVWNTHGLTGAGQIVGTLDTGFDTGNMATMNADFTGRIVSICNFGGYTAADAGGHGTHTAGSIVGNGANSDGRFRGVAYGAQLYVQAAGNGSASNHTPQVGNHNYTDLFTWERDTYCYSIHSDSWGSTDKGDYGSFSFYLDRYVWEHPDLLVVVANGNSGSDKQTVGSPATAKNCLAVGAARSLRPNARDVLNENYAAHIYSLSSRGPCKDGRIKPDICAPGENIISVNALGDFAAAPYEYNNKYCYSSGTSMATPLTAGAAALVREYLFRDCGFTDANPPTAALMKAILCGGAKDLYYTGDYYDRWRLDNAAPNNHEGWGMVDVAESLFPTNGVGVYFRDRLPFAEGTNLWLTVTTTNTAPLDVQLVWIDHPAEVYAEKTLVNDLDLTVTSSASGQNTTWYGNDYNYSGRGPDRLNTVESVRLRDVPAGVYTVHVSCPIVPYDSTEGGAAAIYLRGAFAADKVVYSENNSAEPPLPVSGKSLKVMIK